MHNFVKIWGDIFPNIGNNLKKKRFENFKEVCMYSKILRKFKGTARKLLKQAILRKFFLYFGNIFRNNHVIRNFK